MAADHFCLRWNNYQSNMVSELDILRTEEHLVDVTLCCEGHKFRAHKVILSACSPYFRYVFKENPCEHPVVILKDVLPDDVEALLSFVYQGVVYVSEKKLSSFLQTAELLQIKGLAGAASSFIDEQAKQASVAGQPPKRRKGAPVRILKQDEEEGATQMEDDEGSLKQECVEDMDDIKQEDDGSLEEESGSEASGGSGGGGGGGSGDLSASTFASADLRDDSGGPESKDRCTNVNAELIKPDHNNDQMATLLQQTLSRARAPPSTVPSQPSLEIAQGQFHQGTNTSNQPTPERLSPAVDRRRPCPLCTKVISNKSNLLKHMRIRHSDVYNPACCLLCNKLFKNKYSLRAHLNIYHKQYINTTGNQTSNNQAGGPPVLTANVFPAQPPTPLFEATGQPQYLPSA